MSVPAEIFWLPCNDDEADTVIVDSLGNDGTLAGGDNTEDKSEAGKVGDCLHFNGVDDEGQFGDLALAEFGTTDPFTIMAWVNPDAVGTAGYILTKFDANTGWGMYWNGGQDKLYLYTDGAANAASNAVFTDADWVHVGMVYNGDGSVNFWRNGVAAGGGSGLTITKETAHQLILGNRTGGNSGHRPEMAFDDVRMFGEACTEAHIQAVYNGGDGSALSLAQLMGKPTYYRQQQACAA